MRLLIEGFKLDVVMETVPYQPKLVQFVNMAVDQYLVPNEHELLDSYSALDSQEAIKLVCSLVVLAIVCQDNSLVCKIPMLDDIVSNRKTQRVKLLDLEDRIDELYIRK